MTSYTKRLRIYSLQLLPLHKKWSFLLRISSVNMTKFAGNCGFGLIYWRILNRKLHFLCSLILSENSVHIDKSIAFPINKVSQWTINTMKVQILILWIIFIRQLETIVSRLSCFLCLDLPPGWYLLVQSQQLKHKNNVWGLRKVNKKDTRRMFSDVFSGCKERSLEWNALK